MSQINIRNLSNENDDGSPEIVGVSTFSATSFFVPPKGNTAERPSECEPGSIRFNTDTANLEYFRGKTIGWSQFELVTSNLGGGTGSNTGLGARGVLMGGYESYPSIVSQIDFLTISTLGNTQDFGDMNAGSGAGAVCSSRIRALHSGGQTPSNVNNIEFITFSSLGNGTNFGDLTQVKASHQAGSDQTRGIMAGGKVYPASTYTDTIEYVTMASEGNAVDFGNLTLAKSHGACANSSVRFVHASGQINPSGYTNVMDFITTSSTGNATDFGDTVNSGAYGWTMGVVSSPIRGLFALGSNDSGTYNSIEFITIATLGNAQDFGDLSETEVYKAGMCSSTRGLFAGGSDPSISNVIDFVTIQTTGNSLDFGDITTTGRAQAPGGSNAHGGL
jgi:hypothetical protein